MNRPAALLLIIGLLQMTGEVLGLSWLKGVGAATTASPAPKVFSKVGDLETYSTRFYLEWTDREGKKHSQEITPDVNSRLRGPYNRRNVYGAALAYGPVLVSDDKTRPMFEAVMKHAVTGEAPLLKELGIDPASVAGPVRVRFEPLPGTDMGSLPRAVEAPQ